MSRNLNLAWLTQKIPKSNIISSFGQQTPFLVMYQIDNNFAREQNLKSEDVIVNLELAGNKTERLETKIFQLELFDTNGIARSVWGYGCDKIMSPYDPVDLRKVRHLFPNLPDSAFYLVPERRIDILLGLNFFGLHPRGDPQMAKNLVAEIISVS